MRKVIKVSNITCTNCASSIETHFSKFKNIEAKVLVTSQKVVFNYNDKLYDEKFLIDELLSIGFYPVKENQKNNKNIKKDKIDLIIAAIFSLPLLYTMFEHLGFGFMPMPKIFLNGYFQWILASFVLFISGRRFFIASYYSIKNKKLGMDILVVIGTVSAYIYSIYETLTKTNPHLYFETTAVVILMVLIGNYFENRVKEKTNDTLESLLSLSVKEARVLEGNEEIVKNIDDIKKGDILLIKGYEKIPIDGILIEGKTYVDESMFTGEMVPVLKNIGDEVLGSSMNILGTIKIEVTKVGEETLLSQIIKTVEETSLIKPKAQKVADKIASIFVPIVILISISTLLVWLFILKKPFSIAISPAIAVLVVSCPCALGLATPTSVSVASGLAFKEGVLYKGGEFFEVANKINSIAFDKTGTLTKGIPIVSDFYGNKDSLIYLASLEKHSTHPISKAILNYYEGEFLEVENYETLIGYGIKGKINNKNVLVVSNKYLIENKINNPFTNYKILQKEGKTIFYTIIDNKVESLIAITDEIKESSYKLINELKNRNIKTYMITGDDNLTANYIADKLKIDNIYANVLPHEKSNIIMEIRKKDGIVAYVGDGINDAPALKAADVGFAVGSGSDIALSSADVTLVNDDLLNILYAIDLSKATLKNIYMNFFWAFIYNIVMIPLASFNIFSPTLAGLGMAFSSIMVVLNALSLKRFKKKDGYMKEIIVENMNCMNCYKKIDDGLKDKNINANINLETKSIKVNNYEYEQAIKIITNLGYKVKK